MKILLNILCLTFLLQSFAQTDLTTADWQSDLRFLQNTVHKDYPFLFKKVTKAEFDSEVEKLYNDIPNMEAHEVPVAFSRIVALFKYGHTQIPFSTVARRGALPVNLYHFNDGIYIEGTMKAHKNTLGAKVIKVEGVGVEEALKQIRPVVPAENDQYFKNYGLRFLTVPDVLHAQGVLKSWSENITLTLEKEGKIFDYTFPTIAYNDLSSSHRLTVPNDNWISVRDQSKTPLYLKDLNEKYYYFEYLENSKTLYVRQSSVFDDPKESLKEFYERLFNFMDTNPIDKLIYDVRLNGGGNNYNNLQLIKGLMARPHINQKGKFFFIIGRETFSACQNLTNEITRYTEAILVGEPTAENVNFYGDARRVVLPKSGIRTYLSYAWWQDVPQWENKEASIPHLAVDMSFEDYRTNGDPVLDAALNYKENGFILDPMQHLTQLFMAGDFEKVKEDAIKIAHSKAYKYYDFNEEFNKAAQRLLNSGSPEAQQSGIHILQLITEVYPESQSALYNLGNALEDNDQMDNALKAYNKLITLDDSSMLARAAKNRIEIMKKE